MQFEKQECNFEQTIRSSIIMMYISINGKGSSNCCGTDGLVSDNCFGQVKTYLFVCLLFCCFGIL